MLGMMEEMFRDMDPERMRSMMEAMTSMMEQCFPAMDAEEMGSMMREMMPKMMECCLPNMDAERRAEMLNMCREMLDQMEEKYSSQEVQTAVGQNERSWLSSKESAQSY